MCSIFHELHHYIRNSESEIRLLNRCTLVGRMPVRAGEIKKCVTNVAAISYFPKEFLKESRITRRSFGGRTGAAPFEFSNLLGRLVTLLE